MRRVGRSAYGGQVTLGSASRESWAALLLVWGVLSAGPAAAACAHTNEDGSLGVRGMSEKELRKAETAMLGPEHAAEHARQRAIAREAKAEGITKSDETIRSSLAAQAAATSDPTLVGQWASPFSIPVTGTHAVMLPTGKVMWWAYPNGFQSTNTAQAWLWDPATGTTNRVDPPLWRDPADGELKPANIWCAGQTLLADGRVLVIGGNLANSGPTPKFKGLNKVYTFNPFNETWTEQPDMPHGRWYPSTKLLPDGRALIMGGLDENGQGVDNPDIELFTPSTNMNGVGTLATIGTRGGA